MDSPPESASGSPGKRHWIKRPPALKKMGGAGGGSHLTSPSQARSTTKSDTEGDNYSPKFDLVNQHAATVKFNKSYPHPHQALMPKTTMTTYTQPRKKPPPPSSPSQAKGNMNTSSGPGRPALDHSAAMSSSVAALSFSAGSQRGGGPPALEAARAEEERFRRKAQGSGAMQQFAQLVHSTGLQQQSPQKGEAVVPSSWSGVYGSGASGGAASAAAASGDQAKGSSSGVGSFRKRRSMVIASGGSLHSHTPSSVAGFGVSATRQAPIVGLEPSWTPFVRAYTYANSSLNTPIENIYFKHLRKRVPGGKITTSRRFANAAEGGPPASPTGGNRKSTSSQLNKKKSIFPVNSPFKGLTNPFMDDDDEDNNNNDNEKGGGVTPASGSSIRQQQQTRSGMRPASAKVFGVPPTPDPTEVLRKRRPRSAADFARTSGRLDAVTESGVSAKCNRNRLNLLMKKVERSYHESLPASISAYLDSASTVPNEPASLKSAAAGLDVYLCSGRPEGVVQGAIMEAHQAVMNFAIDVDALEIRNFHLNNTLEAQRRREEKLQYQHNTSQQGRVESDGGGGPPKFSTEALVNFRRSEEYKLKRYYDAYFDKEVAKQTADLFGHDPSEVPIPLNVNSSVNTQGTNMYRVRFAANQRRMQKEAEEAAKLNAVKMTRGGNEMRRLGVDAHDYMDSVVKSPFEKKTRQ